MKRILTPRGLRLRDEALVPWVCALLIGAAILLPAITSLERVTFSVAGLDMNVRVAVYFTIAAVTGPTAASIVLRMERRPVWLYLMLAMIAWFSVTAILAHRTPVEWLPTIVRLVLYFGTTTIWYWYARSLSGRADVERLARLLPVAVLAIAAIPAVAGLAELIRGDAPVINGAPRIAGSMPSHPVAYSLVLSVSALATVGPAILSGGSRGAVYRWAAVAMLTALVFATFTRLSILLLVAAGAMIGVLLPAPPRLRWARFAGAVVVGMLIVLLAQPTFEARFQYPVPLSQVIAGDGANPSPGADASSGLTTGTVWNPEVDESIAYRIMLTQHGLKYFAQSPFIGHGPGSFDRLFEADSGRAGVPAHDDFLSFAVETGLPGLVIYLCVLLALTWALWPRGSTGIPMADSLIVTALVAVLAFNAGAAIHNPTYFVEIQMPIWIMVGTALGLKTRRDLMAGGARGATRT